MALQHVLPSRIYSAEELYKVSEGQPFGWSIKKWKRMLLIPKSKLKFEKAGPGNYPYHILGKDFLRYVEKYNNNISKQ